MWKKPDEATSPHSDSSPAAPTPSRSNPAAGGQALIGASIRIKGDLRGEEDLVILGQVEGKIDCRKNRVTIGQNGSVKADVYGEVIVVEGMVDGNLYGGQQIVLKSSGTVHGNLVAPRVSLEDGGRFKGSIDMGRGEGGSQKQEVKGKGQPSGRSSAPSQSAAGGGQLRGPSGSPSGSRAQPPSGGQSGR